MKDNKNNKNNNNSSIPKIVLITNIDWRIHNSILSGLWVGMFGYSWYKPKEFLVVLIALHTSSQLGSDVSEIGSMPSNAVRGSGRGLGGAGSCWRSFQVSCFFQTARPVALISSSGSTEGWKQDGLWEVSLGEGISCSSSSSNVLSTSIAAMSIATDASYKEWWV